MFEAIIGGIVAVALGIAANILTPHIQDKLRLNKPKNPPPPEAAEPPDENATDEELEAWRARNRRKLELLFWQVYVYGASFFAMFAAVNVPLNWAAGIGAEALDLEATRLSVSFILGSDKFSFVSAVVAMALYIPCWYVAQKVADLATAIALRYTSVNEVRYGAFVALGMFFMALLVAGHAIYLLNPVRGYIESVVAPFMVLLVVGAFASSRR